MFSKKLILLMVVLVACLLLAFVGSSLVNQGNSISPSTSLPFGLEIEAVPGFRGGGHVIREKSGFALVGKGVSYRDIDLQVEQLMGYGVQKNALSAQVADEDGQVHFIKITESAAPTAGQPFRVDWLTEKEAKNLGGYTWVDLQAD